MLRYMTSGESHGPQLTAIVSGLPAGLAIDRTAIDRDLARRQGGYGRGGRMTIERDAVRVVSGVRHGQAIGSPITLVVENRDWANWGAVMCPDAPPAGPEGDAIRAKRKITRPRPGHADLAGVQKFDRQDARDILERASARATAMQVAVGALAKAMLAELGMRVISHVVRFGPIAVAPPASGMTYAQIAEAAEANDLRVANPAQAAEIRALIDRCKRDGDTVGGVFEVVATGLPAGLGNVMNWDEKLDGKIGQALMSLQAIKGVEIGMGFVAAARLGSQVHDAIEYSANADGMPDGQLDGHGPSGGFFRRTNGAGGLEGGMTNGEPLVVRAAMKPIATLMRPIGSVDFATKEALDSSKERSDVCALPAAAVIGEALVAFALAEAVLAKFGGDSMAELRRNYDGYVATLARNPANGQGPAAPLVKRAGCESRA